MMLQSLGGGTGFLKAGLLGFAGAGKTWTAKELAVGVRAHFKLEGPIAMLDTEGGAQYINGDVRKRTGKDLVGVQTRTLGDAVDFLRACENQGVSVAIIDSVTHLWRELCESYLSQVNEALVAKGKNRRTRLEFQDWNPIKQQWAVFANLYLNSRLHVIICGRAGYEWDFEEREDGTGKDLVKTGVKMKTEGEFGYEPSVLVQMEQVQTVDGKHVSKIVRRATVLKDRFGVIDGLQCDNPTYEFFRPHADLLTPGSAVIVDVSKQTPLKVDESGDAEWQRERRQRAIFSEEVMGLMTSAFPGQSAADKKAKADILHITFQTRSWTAVENMEAWKIKQGLDAMPKIIAEYLKSLEVVEEHQVEPIKGSKKAEKAVTK